MTQILEKIAESIVNEPLILYVSHANIKEKVTDANPSPIRMVRYAKYETLTKQRDMLLEACKKSSAHVRPTCDELYQELQTIIKQVESE